MYDATLSGHNLVGEIASLGEIETTSSELLISFKSDCDVTNKGFQAVVEFVEKSTESNEDVETLSAPDYELDYTEITTAKTTTTYYPSTTTRLGKNADYTETKLYVKLCIIKTNNLSKVNFFLFITFEVVFK